MLIPPPPPLRYFPWNQLQQQRQYYLALIFSPAFHLWGAFVRDSVVGTNEGRDAKDKKQKKPTKTVLV